jgi:protein tyrosine/serine phosphatase
VDDNVYRGKQPTKDEIPKLAAMGVKTVLDLRERFERKGWEQGAVEAAGMQYVRIGLPGTLEPTNHEIDQILALIEDSKRGPVFIHCRRGADRTGLVIACYRIAHDHWTNAQALQEAREHGLSRFEILMRRYIEHFTPAPAGGR